MSSNDSVGAETKPTTADEKVTPAPAAAAVGADGKVQPVYQADLYNEYDEEDFWTRNGLNANSFRVKHYGRGIVELDRTMKTRHLHMIAIGGSIGAGFFVGSGSAFASGGPGSVLICFALIGIMIFNTVFALGELAIMYPVSGGFYTYSTRFIDPSWGFAMGWNYVFQWAIVLPLELTVCAITIEYWNDEINMSVWITVLFVVVIFVNLFGTIGYAEEEFWSSCLKLSAIVIFMIVALILVLGGGPSSGRYGEYWGARTWYDPGAFVGGFKGFCSVFVTAAFSFAGTELVGLAAAEARNPVKALPGAIKQVFWRITLFFILGLFMVGLLVPADDDRLLAGNPDYPDPKASPFVLAALYAGLDGYDHFMNFIILVSVLSLGVSCVYGGSRCLTALAQQGYAPVCFTYIDKSGRPLWSVLAILACGPIAYVGEASDGGTVFAWLLATSGLATLFTWGSILVAHIRFRKAWKYHGHTEDEIPFKAVGGVVGSYIGLFIIFLALAGQFYTAINLPVNAENAQAFFQSYLAAPIVLLFWICGYFWKRTGWLRTHQMDVDTGRRELDWDAINAYKATVATWPAWKRVMHKIF